MIRIFPSAVLALLLTVQGIFASEVTIDTAPLDADVVVMGELHDNGVHHLNQAYWITKMRAKAVVFEMLDPAQALAATTLRDAPPDQLNEALEWEARGWPEFSLYYPIFEALGEAAIFGATLPPDRIEAAFVNGPAAGLGGAGALFQLDQDLPPDQLALRLALQDDAHCGLMPAAQLPGMVAVQRMRDAALAQAVIAAWAETGGPVAVITGNGHARKDWGLPYLLGLAQPDLSVLSLAQFPAPPAEDPPYDAWLFTPPAAQDKQDPCDALR